MLGEEKRGGVGEEDDLPLYLYLYFVYHCGSISGIE